MSTKADGSPPCPPASYATVPVQVAESKQGYHWRGSQIKELRCYIIPRLRPIPNVHKNAMALGPIVSFIGSATYNLSKEIVRIVEHLVDRNVHHIRNATKTVI